MLRRYLELYRELSRDQEKATSALWGQLAGNILMGNWDQAAEDLKQLRDILDSKVCFLFTNININKFLNDENVLN
jgi:hypothetical protein